MKVTRSHQNKKQEAACHCQLFRLDTYPWLCTILNPFTHILYFTFRGPDLPTKSFVF
jgi:hypothetical protein